MIPTVDQCKKLWDTYHLPSDKRVHMQLVNQVAIFFAKQLHVKVGINIDTQLLCAAALLHDIDKAIPRRGNEHHPDAGVRVLRGQGFGEVADLIRAHSLPAILDHNISPKTWEEKILFLADKMVKYEILDVDRRFDLWRSEQLSQAAVRELDQAYPRVKELEQEICTLIGVLPSAIAALA